MGEELTSGQILQILEIVYNKIDSSSTISKEEKESLLEYAQTLEKKYAILKKENRNDVSHTSQPTNSHCN